MGRDYMKEDKLAGVLDDRPAVLHSGAKKGFPKAIVAVVLVLLLCAAAFYYFARTKDASTKSKSDKDVAVLTVSTQKACMKEIDRHISVNGSIMAWDPLSVGAEMALRVESINVEEGDEVKKGQVLATLNSSVLKAQLAQQKARLAADEAALKKAIQPNRPEDLNSWRAALMQAEANLAQEEANLLRIKAHAANLQENSRRYAELRKVGAVSQMDADTKWTEAKTSAADVSAAEKKVDASRHALSQAKERLAMAEKGGRHEDIVISRATLQESKAKIDQLEAMVEQTVVRAPADGKIVKREVHLGEISSVGKNMFTMVRNSKLEMRALIPEVDLTLVKAGMPVKLSAKSEGESITGYVREVSPAVDERTRLGVARIDLPESCKFMKPGLFYHADINLGKDKVLVIPSRAVLSRNDRDVVYLFANGKAELRHVQIGDPFSDGSIEIRKGLSAGEQVIVSGAGFMKDGDTVRAVPEDSAQRN